MKIMIIFGNPKHGGFVHQCLDQVGKCLESQGAQIDQLKLVDSDIRDCVGCFTCLRTGSCSIRDDMDAIVERMIAADGLVAGASVRNSYFPALYKRFYERITYLLGFTRELRGKHVLGIGAVGMASGKKHLGRLLTFREFQTHVVDYLFFRTGIPTRLKIDDVSQRLNSAADQFYNALLSQSGLSAWSRLRHKADDIVVRKLMLQPNPDHVYDYIIDQWRKKGLL